MLTKYKETLENLVRKYNKGLWDEDLMQEAYLVAWKCLKTTSETDEEIIKGQIITWVKNRLIDLKVKKRKLHTVTLPEGFELVDNNDYSLTMVELKASLNDRECEVLNYLLDGYSVKDIASEMNLTQMTIYRTIKRIKLILTE